MNLLCWHGTVLRVDKATGAWFHALPWPDEDGAIDLALDLPDGLPSHPVLLPDGLVAEPAPDGRRLFVRRDKLYLSAEPFRPFVHFAALLASPHETFLPVAPPVMDAFRAVLRGWSRVAETDARVQATRADSFRLRVNDTEFPLETAEAGTGGNLILRDGKRVLTLVPEPASAPPRRVPVPLKAAPITHAEAGQDFAAGKSEARVIAAGEDRLYPPLTLTDADALWIQQKPWWPDRQIFGPVQTACEMACVRGACVLNSRGQEGTIFDEAGIYTDPIHLDGVHVFSQAPLTRHGPRVYLDEPTLRAAPLIEGPHVVFYGGIAGNYYHWLIESLVPLCAMVPHLPDGTKLLLPQSFDDMRDDPRAALAPPHRAMLQDWGFGGMPKTIVAAPVCLVEEVYFLRNLNLESFPGSVLRLARERVLGETDAAQAGRRIYIRRSATRRVANGAEIEQAVIDLGFELHDMRGLSAAAQIALFRSASMVIAPHGAELANLLFCQAGTEVIELSPDVQFRYFYAQLSDKLGLSHAVLPCASLTGHFDGDMHVDRGRLLDLIRMMQARA